VRRLDRVTLLGQREVERQRGVRAAALLGAACGCLSGEVVLERAQQERAQPPALALGTREALVGQELGEEALRRVTRVVA